MKEFVLFVFLLSLILIITGYLEMYFDNKKFKNKVEYRFVPRDIYDSLEYNNLDEQFSYMFNANDARNATNLI